MTYQNTNALSSYFEKIDGGKLLTREEEISLAKRVKSGDLEARKKLINSNLRLVASIAKFFQGKGCDLEDLIQEGNLGLMTAIDKFDLDRNLRLSTYATWWIRQRVERAIANHGKTVRVPVHVQNLAAKFKKLLDAYVKEFGCNPSVEEVMDMLGCTEEMAKATMMSIIPNQTITLDHSPSSQIENDETLHSYIEDTEIVDMIEFVSHNDLIKLIRGIIKSLSPRDEKILRLRFGISEDFVIDDEYKLTDKEAQELTQRILLKK